MKCKTSLGAADSKGVLVTGFTMQAISTEQFVDWSYGLRRSDRKAYQALYNSTHPTLFRYAWHITHDENAAYDVLQDVFMKLWQVRDTIDPERSLKALLYQMVRNYSLNHERRKKRQATDSLDDGIFEPVSFDANAEDLDASALRDRINAWIAELPSRRREAFMLSRFEGLSHEEIARIMGLTKKTVNNHIVLALQHLRARLDAYEPEVVEP